MPKILLINYGVGNLRSGKKGLEKAGAKVEIIDSDGPLPDGDAIVLPGVGAFVEARKNIASQIDKIKDESNSGKPIFGICLGLQLLFTKSYEGVETEGLNLIPGEVIKISNNVKLPQIGWNTIDIVKSSPLLEGVKSNSFMYFVHSYYANPNKNDIAISYTEYGDRFPSIIESRNIFATQFHPEKSGNSGLTILKNFVNMLKR